MRLNYSRLAFTVNILSITPLPNVSEQQELDVWKSIKNSVSKEWYENILHRILVFIMDTWKFYDMVHKYDMWPLA
jgi:hypothetical protein